MTRHEQLRFEWSQLVERLHDFDRRHEVDMLTERALSGDKQAAAEWTLLSITKRLPLQSACDEWVEKHLDEYVALANGE